MSVARPASSPLRLGAALVFALALGALGLGCGDGNSDFWNFGTGPTGGGGGGNGGGTMSATVDGMAWEADEVQATLDGGVLAFAGAEFPGGSANMQINITVAMAQLGEQSLTAPNVAIYSNTTGPAVEDISSYLAVSTGTINIQTLSESGASGTFSFTGNQTLPQGQTGMVVVTNGLFDVTF